ncbi:aspartyl/glutamyl-tRNA amidotransferase subunit C [Mycoplasma anatis]|uniref:Asp-tRNA(Asn)/Glu-tRNA(Gln) amidotransferase subunit GatC n=1 Tax=Mycoplasmopsis anatis TaxID=171279 RepID=UPI001C4E185F|nr:Asp-tRNA(Asn)/Glu-tRNA(Gln) amidotransferase subunit GatC [Mycoplasmopsis anatis]MBW0594721.1 aspartyl/glutamyl-tRNA amidotransferase subunit C [Mycoplasmopsis anatis]MBW0598299.1 aspartyl/glutamyl-tRNA amidotransferase subunit C [Mycoplasmopsis anatis]MBW0599045.1 aspartyl/glutamyl-tRNA amidotransferase subunit C [Mycoplasmopsis anatis]MBW0601330.1 aspartyl/glutamyl-tRNA amidotransferase subunit C [Mycoplasmopsis anatis]
MNKSITKEELYKIAETLMLKPTEEVVEEILKDWEVLQKYIQMMSLINTDNVKPMTHINENYQVDFFREDIEDDSWAIKKEHILSNATESDRDFIITKKVVK